MKDKTAKHTSMWFMECMTRRPCDCTLMHGVKRAGERTCWGNSQPHYISQQYVIEWFSDILVPRAFSLLGGWGREKALGRRMVLRYPALLASCETPGDVINRPIFRNDKQPPGPNWNMLIRTLKCHHRKDCIKILVYGKNVMPLCWIDWWNYQKWLKRYTRFPLHNIVWNVFLNNQQIDTCDLLW